MCLHWHPGPIGLRWCLGHSPHQNQKDHLGNRGAQRRYLCGVFNRVKSERHFVFWPKQIEHGHQTDLRLGADCSATVIYGKRRMGHSVGYVAPKGLLRYLEAVDTNSVRVGDVLHFGFQTALLSQDTVPLGVLNDSDLILHSPPSRWLRRFPFRMPAMRNNPSRCTGGWMCFRSEVPLDFGVWVMGSDGCCARFWNWAWHTAV